jgi:23S rRNA (cytosine1962-C5)-methyltransferase
MTYLLDLKVKKHHGGFTEAGELGLRVSATGSVLPCGASARWQRD